MSNKSYLSTIIIWFTLVIGCKSKNEKGLIRWDIKLTSQQLTKNQIAFDTIYVNHPNVSFRGFWKMDGDNLLFFDKLFATVVIFDKTGKYVSTFLGKGQGQKECEGIDSWCKKGNINLIFNGYKTYHYNSNWERIKVATLNFNATVSRNELENNPKAEYMEIYEVKYFHNNHTMLDSNKVLFNIESTHPKFNGYFSNSSKEYFQQANIFAKLNVNTGRWEESQGNYSNYYVQHPNIINFSNWSYDIDAHNLYLNFDADSLIYVYDKQFKPLYAFGRKGLGMNQKYIETTTYDESNSVFHQERVKKGYYSDIKRLEENNLTFRCYTTGNDNANIFKEDYTNNRRMQIYKNTVLVADVIVPNRFNLIGYDKSFIYADGFVDDINEKLAFFKFKIPNL